MTLAQSLIALCIWLIFFPVLSTLFERLLIRVLAKETIEQLLYGMDIIKVLVYIGGIYFFYQKLSYGG